MIYFIDERGEQYSAISECKRTKGVNGEKSLSGTIYTNEKLLHGIGRGWRLKFEDEIYCLTYVNPIDEGKRIVVEFDAVHEFFFDMQKSVVHRVLNGSNTAETYLKHIFDGSGYTYRLEVAINAFSKENFGLKNRLDLFKDFISSTEVEFSVSGRVVRILEKVGTNLSTIVKKGFNLNELHIEKNISSFITYLKGYGAYKDEQDHSKGRLEVEYTSPLANLYGKLEGDPIVDERYTQKESLLERIKGEVESSYQLSVEIDMEDLTKAGYEYDQPHEGDSIMAINKDLGFEQKIRIMSYTTSFDTEGNVIDHEISCGSLNLVHQSQTNETSWKKQMEQSINEANQTANFALVSADGQSMIYYGPDEPMGEDFRKGTTWYQTVGDKQIMKIWNGSEWWPLLDKSEWESIQREFEKQQADLEQAKRSIAEMNTNVEKAVEEAGFAKDGVTTAEKKAADALSQAQTAYEKGQTLLQDVTALRQKAVNAERNITNLGAQFSYLSDGIDVVAGKADQLTEQVSEVKLTADRFQLLLTEKTDDLTTRLSTSEQRLDGFQTEVLEQIQGVTTRLSTSEQTVTRFKNSLSEQVNGLVTRLTESEQNAQGFQQRVTDQLKGITSTQTQLSGQITSAIESIDKNKEAIRSQLTQLSDRFNLTVQKGELIAQLNMEAGKTLIQNKQLVLDAETVSFTGNAFIPMAMIKDLRVDAATIYGTLDASKVRTINIDAANISSGYINNERLRSRSITADKLATNAIQVGFNNYSQNLKLDPYSLNFYNGTQLAGSLTSEGMEFWYGTRKIGYVGETSKKGNANVRGIAMNLENTGDFVSWGYKKSSSDSVYTTMLLLDPKGKFSGKSGIHLDATAWMRKIEGQNGTLEIGTPGAYQSVKFGVNKFNNTNYPALTANAGKVGIAFGSTELYLLRNNTAYALNNIVTVTGVLKGLGKVSIPRSINSDGTVKTWVEITL